MDMEWEARPAARGSVWRLIAIYVAVSFGAALVFRGIQSWGASLEAPARDANAAVVEAARGTTIEVLPRVLLTLAVLIGVGQLLARLFRRWGQPAVIGEVVAGILLGPSLLGRFWPEAMHWLIPGRDADPQRMVLGSL